MKQESLDIYLTTFFAVWKFKNRSAMRVILFGKCSKLNIDFRTAKKKKKKKEKRMQKKTFVSEIIASEDVAINCLY